MEVHQRRDAEDRARVDRSRGRRNLAASGEQIVDRAERWAGAADAGGARPPGEGARVELLVVMHHLIVDGVAPSVVIGELLSARRRSRPRRRRRRAGAAPARATAERARRGALQPLGTAHGPRPPRPIGGCAATAHRPTARLPTARVRCPVVDGQLTARHPGARTEVTSRPTSSGEGTGHHAHRRAVSATALALPRRADEAERANVPDDQHGDGNLRPYFDPPVPDDVLVSTSARSSCGRIVSTDSSVWDVAAARGAPISMQR